MGKDALLIIPTNPIEGYDYVDFNSDMLKGIAEDQRKINAVFRLAKVDKGKRLTITKLPTTEGDVTLKVGWAGPGHKDYNIHVVPQDSDEQTLQYILDKILEYNYTGITDVLSDDGKSVDFSITGGGNETYETTVEFIDRTNTGMSVSITNTDSAKSSVAKYFIGNNLDADWENIEKWIEGNAINLSMGWKSTIEQLILAYPKAHIFVAMFPAHAVSSAEYQMPNGYYNSAEYYNNSRMLTMRHHRETLKEIANFYSIPFIDVFEECGIGITNMLTYYQVNANVHPKNEGYIRFGQTIAAQIKRFL